MSTRKLSSLVSIAAVGLSAASCSGGDKTATQGSNVDLGKSAPTTTQAPTTDGSAAAATSSAAVDASGKPAAGIPKDLNVLVISIDSMRSDHLAFGGGREEVMPTVNAFEKTAVSYTRYHSISSYTAQSLGGFLGSRYPSEMKRNGSFFSAYPEDETMFPELLQKAGVRTMTAHAHFYFQKGRAGFDQGFDLYDLVPGIKKNNTTDESITSPAHTEIALRHLSDAANTSKRFFAWYHFLDPHNQYLSHEEGKDFGKGAKNKYDGELYFVDMHVKKILDLVDSQPWGKKTMVIVTADHGEAFGEHKQYRHGFELWENLTHVPLMIRVPGGVPRRIDATRSGIDVPATILDALGVAPDPSYHGVSLVPELAGGDAAPRDVVSDLARTGDNDRRRTLIRGDFKIIELGNADGFQLFNLKDNPKEETDLARKDKAKLEEMRGALKDFEKSIKEVCPKGLTDKLKNKKKGHAC